MIESLLGDDDPVFMPFCLGVSALTCADEACGYMASAPRLACGYTALAGSSHLRIHGRQHGQRRRCTVSNTVSSLYYMGGLWK